MVVVAEGNNCYHNFDCILDSVGNTLADFDIQNWVVQVYIVD